MRGRVHRWLCLGAVWLGLATAAAKGPAAKGAPPTLHGATTFSLPQPASPPAIKGLGFVNVQSQIQAFSLTDSGLIPISIPATSAPGVPPPPALDPFLDVVSVGDEGRFWCTGTLVAPDVVLTAAHCLPAASVHFGPRADSGGTRASVRSSVRAPGDADAALLFLGASSATPRHPWRSAREHGAPWGQAMLVGFGATDADGRRGAGLEREGEMTLSGWGCDGSRPLTTGCAPAREMVLAAQSGRDTCKGDSGGPLFERHGDGWRLIAITSRPIGSSRVACGEGGIYVRIDAIADWMNQAIHDAGGHSRP